MHPKNTELLVARHVDFAIGHHGNDVGIPSRIGPSAGLGVEQSVERGAAGWLSFKREKRNVRWTGVVRPRNGPDNRMIFVVRRDTCKESRILAPSDACGRALILEDDHGRGLDFPEDRFGPTAAHDLVVKIRLTAPAPANVRLRDELVRSAWGITSHIIA